MIKRLENQQKHCMYAFQRFLEVLPDYYFEVMENKIHRIILIWHFHHVSIFMNGFIDFLFVKSSPVA